MPETRSKSLSHRRAEWTVANPPTLESCIKAALGKLTTVSSRTVALGDGRELKCLSADVRPACDGAFLHITVETPGEQASVVPKTTDADTTEVSVNVADAPADAEFMDGDAFVYVKDNDVCLCTTTTSEATVKLYLYSIFAAARIRKDANKFDLFKSVDASKLAMLQKDKIKEIRIKASAYKASAAYAQRQADAAGVMGNISKWIRAFCGAEHDVTNDSMRVELTLKTDKRSKQHLGLGERRIEEIATDLIENEQSGDEYAIELESGNTIGPKELFVKANVMLEKLGKSVNKDVAWEQLRLFYVSLEDSGTLSS